MELDGNETGLEAYYNMNNGTDTTLTDHSANANHGTIYGATWSTDIPTLASTEDADYQNNTDELIISWSGSDAASGITTYEYVLGTTSGGTDVIDWTSAGFTTAYTLTGLTLMEGTTYYLSVRATDAAGNLSDISNADGITIDVTSPAGTTVNDGTGADIAYTGSDSSLSAIWPAFTEAVSLIAKYQVAIGTSSGATDVVDWWDNSTDTSCAPAHIGCAGGTA